MILNRNLVKEDFIVLYFVKNKIIHFIPMFSVVFVNKLKMMSSSIKTPNIKQ